MNIHVNKGVPKNIICISSVDWFPIPTRKQQVMSRLPKDYNILYVEPPITLLSPLKDKKMTFKLSEFKKGNKQIQENIVAYCPPPILPFGNIFKWINKINQWWSALFIKKAAKMAVPMLGIEYDPKIKGFLDILNQVNLGSVEDIDGIRICTEFDKLWDNKEDTKIQLSNISEDLKNKAKKNGTIAYNLIK